MRRDLRRRRAREETIVGSGSNLDKAQDDENIQRRRPNHYEQQDRSVNRPASAPLATDVEIRRGKREAAGGEWERRNTDRKSDVIGNRNGASPGRAALQSPSLSRSPLPHREGQNNGTEAHRRRSPHASIRSRHGRTGVRDDDGDPPRDIGTNGKRDADSAVGHRARRPHPRPLSADTLRPASAEKATTKEMATNPAPGAIRAR